MSKKNVQIYQKILCDKLNEDNMSKFGDAAKVVLRIKST